MSLNCIENTCIQRAKKLVNEVTKEEVKIAIRHLKNLKAWKILLELVKYS